MTLRPHDWDALHRAAVCPRAVAAVSGLSERDVERHLQAAANRQEHRRKKVVDAVPHDAPMTGLRAILARPELPAHCFHRLAQGRYGV